MRINDLMKLKTVLRDAEAYRNSYYTRQDWAEYEELWEGNYNLDKLPDGTDNPTLTVPVLVSDAQRQMASILGNKPRLEVFTNDPEQYAAARVLGAKLTHLMGELDLMGQVREAVQDSVTCGTGFLMTGFGSQYGTHPDTVIDGFDRSRVDANGRRIEYQENLADNMPWTLRAHPAEILIPPGVMRMDSSYGYFHIYQRPVDAVHEDDKLFSKHRHKLEPDSAYDTLTKTSNRRTGDSAFGAIGREGDTSETDLCTLVDWMDYRTNHRITFSPYYSYALRDEVDELLIRLDRLPLETIIFTQPSRGFWGTSDFKMQMPVANEYNDIRTQQAKHRQAQILKALIDRGFFEDEDAQGVEAAIEKLSNDQVAAFLVGQGNPHDAIAFVTPGQPYDFLSQGDQCLRDIREFGAGIGPLQKGQMSPGRHTKYETQSAEGYHDQSMFPRREVVGKAIVHILQNWAKLMFDFWTEPQLCRTYNAAGDPVTVEFKGADLRGDYRFQLSLDSMRSKGQSERVEEANMILSQLQPFTQPDASGKPTVNARNLVKQYMSRLDSDWDVENLLEGQEEQQKPPQQFGQFAQQFQQQQQDQPGIAQMVQQLGAPQ